MYIDAVVIKGRSRGFSCSIATTEKSSEQQQPISIKDGQEFYALDLSDYAVRFRILGSPTADAKVLVEHIITQETDLETIGQIEYPEEGQFTFVVSAEDTDIVGLGNHPIMLELISLPSEEEELILTEGGRNGEFSKIQVVQV